MADIFTQINNAVLDLQAAQVQNYERPLGQLARLLRNESLSEANKELTFGADLEAFLKASDNEARGLGGHKLLWPSDHREALGLAFLLIEKLATEPGSVLSFAHTYYDSGPKTAANLNSLTRQLIIPFARDYKDYVLSRGVVQPAIIRDPNNKIFIVHGHDGEARETVARFVEKIDLVPIILHEQANMGRTVIEKVEANSDVGFAIVLLTPDDLGKAKDGTDLEPRARQNVLLELGYFLARLTRSRVCALKRGRVEIPSDFAGVVWQEMDAGGAWKTALGKELAAAGYRIDWNKIMAG
ncbi:nucleotide-binding protein [Variovorax paradoxus]|uniref:TIR domain-containing protein n=1 Tax=Variovorax paradoxus TaxID=34073 RepID=UPI001ABC0420